MRFLLIFVIVGVGNALEAHTTYIGLSSAHGLGVELMSRDMTRFPERLTMTMSLNEKPLKLVKTRDLFAQSYRSERRGLNDTVQVVHGPPPENCWYHAENPDEMAAVSLCNGVQGLWWIGSFMNKKDRVLWLEPERAAVQGITIKLQDVPSHQHKVLDVTDSDLDRDLRCGTGDIGLFARELHHHRSLEQPVEQATASRQVRVLLVNDHARFVREGQTIEGITINLFNAVKEVYRKAPLMPHLTLSLAGQLTFISADPYKPAMRGGEVLVFGSTGLLDEWNQYRTSMTARLPVHDHGQLLSGTNFESRISGLAGVGTLCSPSISGSITQLTYSQLSNVVIMAHELGHGLGMRHDGSGNTCAKSGYIMQPSISQSLDFSSCSLGDCSSFVQQSGQYCLPLAPIAIEDGGEALITPTIAPAKEAAKETAKDVAKTISSVTREHIGAIAGSLLGIPLGTYMLWRIFKGLPQFSLPRIFKGLPQFSLPKFLKRRSSEGGQPSTTKTGKATTGKGKAAEQPRQADLSQRTLPAEQSEPQSDPAPSTRFARSLGSQPHKSTEHVVHPAAVPRGTFAHTTVPVAPLPGSAAAGGRPLATVGSRKAKEALEDDQDLQVWEGDDIPSTSTKPVQTSEPRTTATKWLDER